MGRFSILVASFVVATLLASAGPAAAIDLPRGRKPSAQAPAPAPIDTAGPAVTGSLGVRVRMPSAPDVDPLAGLGLLQRLAIVLNEIFGDAAVKPAIDPAWAAIAQPDTTNAQPAAATAQAVPVADGATDLVSYTGPLEPGSVVVNIRRLQIYYVLGGGLMEVRRAETEPGLFAMLGTIHTAARAIR